MDAWVAAAREHHRQAVDSSAVAAMHRAERDRLIRRMHEDGWGYKRIAAAVGCTRDTARAAVLAGDPAVSSRCDAS